MTLLDMKDLRTKAEDGVAFSPAIVLALLDENERLRAALEPFAKLAAAYDPPEDDDSDSCWDDNAVPTVGDIRRARDTLEALK